MVHHIGRDRFDLGRPQEDLWLRRNIVTKILLGQPEALIVLVVGVPCEMRHPRAWTATAYRLDDLIPVELRVPERERVTAITAAAAAMPFMAAHAVRTH